MNTCGHIFGQRLQKKDQNYMNVAPTTTANAIFLIPLSQVANDPMLEAW